MYTETSKRLYLCRCPSRSLYSFKPWNLITVELTDYAILIIMFSQLIPQIFTKYIPRSFFYIFHKRSETQTNRKSTWRLTILVNKHCRKFHKQLSVCVLLSRIRCVIERLLLCAILYKIWNSGYWMCLAVVVFHDFVVRLQ